MSQRSAQNFYAPRPALKQRPDLDIPPLLVAARQIAARKGATAFVAIVPKIANHERRRTGLASYE